MNSPEPGSARARPASVAGGAVAQRAEIQGLRAIAVAAVLLFHAGVPFVPGGFLGVDMFFAISGYLITAGLMARSAAGQVSFADFYARRITRLLPAAAATVMLCFAVGWFRLAPGDMEDLAVSALAALAGVSNILFWRQVGYFDTEATLKPLLHTWSLGVEEQFYLLWPALAVAVLRRRGPRTLAVLLLALSLLSVLAGWRVAASDAAAVFYLMPFRIMEFAAGAGLALLALPRPATALQRNLLTGLGIALLLVSVTGLDTAWAARPGVALLPCLGTVLVIHAGQGALASAVLSNRLMRELGAISYPLYLAHWPVVVFLPVTALPEGQFLVLLLSLLIAILLHVLVEKPILRRSRQPGGLRPMLLVSGLLGLLLVLLPALFVLATHGLAFRMPPGLPPMPGRSEMWRERNELTRVKPCFLNSPQPLSDFDQSVCLGLRPGVPNVLVVGDSFAADLRAALQQAYPGLNVLQATASNCTPVIANPAGGSCTGLMQLALEQFPAAHRLDAVILSGNWGRAPDDVARMERTVRHLQGLGQRVIVAGPPLRFAAHVPALVFTAGSGNLAAVTQHVFARRSPFDAVNAPLKAAALRLGAGFIDVHALMCGGGCRVFDTAGRLLVIDFGHLSVAGIGYLAHALRSASPDLLAK